MLGSASRSRRKPNAEKGMARILFAWELGSGWGHLTSIHPLAVGLQRRGHRVYAAVRDLTYAEPLFRNLGVGILPAPLLSGRAKNRIDPICTFAQLLHNTTGGDTSTLRALVHAWQGLIECVEPDLLVADHSPTALIATRGTAISRVVVGTGFSAPQPITPFPNWRPQQPNSPEQLWRDERLMMESVNRTLAPSCQLAQLADLYRDVDHTILLTWPELDPFESRPGANYVGPWPELPAKPPTWPDVAGPRVFAYLRPVNALPKILQMLSSRPLSVLLRVSGIDARSLRDEAGDNIRIETEFVDVATAARDCTLALCHATHIMTMTLLSAGKPLVMLPPFLEQRLTADRVAAAGAGIAVNMDNIGDVATAMTSVIGEPCYEERAREFADKYGQVDRVDRLERTIDHLEKLALRNNERGR